MPIRIEGTTLYTVKDLEEMLGAGNSTIRRYIADGRLQGRKLARRWYIPAESLLEYFKENDQSPPPALLEKLQMLEQKLIDKEQRKRDQFPALPQLPRKRGRPSLLQRMANPHAEQSASLGDEGEMMERTHAPGAVTGDSDAEELLAQARRLKEEAARLERLYASERER